MGTEVITYSRIGKEDIRFGKGTFEVVLADGRKVTINEVDVGAILNDASLSSPFSSYWFDVQANPYNAFGNGVTDDGAAIEAALDAAEVTGGTVFFRTGTYAYATSPNFARAGVNIVADRGAIFKHTGSGNAFVLDGGAAGSIYGNRYDNITVQGNSNSTNGIYVRSVHHSIFDHLRVTACAITGSAILIEFCILNEWRTPRVSANEATFGTVPLYGMYVTRRGTGTDHSTTQLITNPIMEGLTQASGCGIVIDYATLNVVLNGTSEGNTNGIWITANGGGNNQITSIDLEANTTNDVLIEGAHNVITNIQSANLITLKGPTALYNHFYGGNVNAVTLDATGGAPSKNTFDSVAYASNAGVFTDAGTGSVRRNLINITSATIEPDRVPHLVVATASLPAASAAMDGTIILEDAGAGDRNLVIYAGGQRFRIDGGAAF